VIQRVFEWFRSDLWRSAAIGLGVISVVVVAVLSSVGAGSDSETEPDAGGPSSGTNPALTSPDSTAADGDGTGPQTPSIAGGFLAVKLDNDPGARPQVGIGSASLLVEVPVEGGLTRFVAIYPRAASGVVGPVRSLRPVDPDLLRPLAVHVVSTGGQPFVLQALDATGLRHITPILFESFFSGGREPPHDTFFDLDVLMPLIAGSEDDAPGLPRGELPQATGEASSIELPFGSVQLRFEDGAYTRNESGVAFPVLDTLDGATAPLAHETIVMFVAERPAGYEDSNGVPVSTFDVIGSGDLLVFRDGEVVEATWSRSAQADTYIFLDAAGRPFGIPAGSTYLALVPRDRSVTFGP
jgi:hypothetical protein